MKIEIANRNAIDIKQSEAIRLIGWHWSLFR